MRAHRLRRQVPARMREADRWTRRDGKRPITLTGRPASTTRRGTWTTYEDAQAGQVGDGVGFMLGDGFACIDLDHCIAVDGMVSDLAQEVLRLNPDAWVELSLSGTGLHVWGLLPEGPGLRQAGFEVYSKARFIVLGAVYRPGGLHPLVIPDRG